MLDDDLIRLNPLDNVAVLLSARGDIPAGHKIALSAIGEGEEVVKYGHRIGRATKGIRQGEWVHSHNLKTALEGEMEYTYQPVRFPDAAPWKGEFMGYLREDGRVGVRNEIWILPSVGCVNRVAENVAARAREQFHAPVYAFPHPYGCSQLGDDLKNTKNLLCALARHPNAGGVLILGLGCENNGVAGMKEIVGDRGGRARYLIAQDAEDEIAEGLGIVKELLALTADDQRTPQPMSKLVIGLKCGGSDGFSGISANPLLGCLSDSLCAGGGKALLTEVPEMFGAEESLMSRAENEEIFQKTVSLINGFKAYYVSNHQPVYENPSPGNKDGGITTLEEKSLGCTEKGGLSPVRDVLPYATFARTSGLSLVWGPGNDLCAVTALAGAGAQIILFTTGRGTPFGSPVPTIKVSTNSNLAARKKNWIDFDAGRLLSGRKMAALTEELKALVLAVAGGVETKAEIAGDRGIAIFKSGVTL